MPSEHIIQPFNDQQQSENQQSQEKICPSCRSPLVDPVIPTLYLQSSDTLLCAACREPSSSERPSLRQAASHDFCIDVGATFERPVPDDAHDTPLQRLDTDDSNDHSTEMYLYSPSLVSPASAATSSSAELAYQRSTISQQFCPQNTASFAPSTLRISLPSHRNTSAGPTRRPASTVSTFDPLVDITRLRVRSQAHHCLYPGATFQGTQKSGRNSYDVNVTIVDVDFTTSFLCGYLCIRGLTEDWPELTTYFDAEIIGSRYGFLTQNWGATEQEDMVHWQRFPAFKHVKNDLKKPLLTTSDRNRGAVFMRWKERFLVPDHRVQDINGASFAGFYYVCVDFSPQPATSSASQHASPASDDDDMDLFSTSTSSTSKPENQRHPSRRTPNTHRSGRSPSCGLRAPSQTATMNGFYFHQNSEPYQQLSLNHIPERWSSSFEFR